MQSHLEERRSRPEDIIEADFYSYVSAANDAISPFDLSIRSTLSQHDRSRVFALVNTTSDPITQLSTSHSADEISFLKRLLDAMFETYNTRRQEVMAITSMQAVRLHKRPVDRRNETQNGSATQGSEGQGLTMAGAERMLKELVQEGWFEKSRAGFYSLSPRALIELRHYLLTTYNGLDEDDEMDEAADRRQDKVKLCAACKDIVTVVRCKNSSMGGFDWLLSYFEARANDVRREIVHVGCTISVPIVSFEHKKQKAVQRARHNGGRNILLVRRQ